MLIFFPLFTVARFSISPQSVTETNTQTNIGIEVVLQVSSPLARDAIVTFSTADGTATGELIYTLILWSEIISIMLYTHTHYTCKPNLTSVIVSPISPAGSDYQTVSADLTFVRGTANGVGMKVQVPIIGDEDGEMEEYFIVSLTPATPDTPTSVNIIIVNDDSKNILMYTTQSEILEMFVGNKILQDAFFLENAQNFLPNIIGSTHTHVFN